MSFTSKSTFKKISEICYNQIFFFLNKSLKNINQRLVWKSCQTRKENLLIHDMQSIFSHKLCCKHYKLKIYISRRKSCLIYGHGYLGVRTNINFFHGYFRGNFRVIRCFFLKYAVVLPFLGSSRLNQTLRRNRISTFSLLHADWHMLSMRNLYCVTILFSNHVSNASVLVKFPGNGKVIKAQGSSIHSLPAHIFIFLYPWKIF